jgi:predicted acylesterase/phospholipase RssA
VVLVLSGGGMKAMAHVGVLRALREMGKEPAEIVAVSAGALVGALVAGGMPYEAMVRLVTSLRRSDIFQVRRGALLLRGVSAPSILDPRALRSWLARSLPVNSFERLALPLRIVATDLDRGETEVFGAGGRTDCSVAEAVFASMALPLYLPPTNIGDRTFADGGLLQVLPLDVAADCQADLVIAVDVGPSLEAPPNWRQLAPALVSLADRSLGIAMAGQRERAIAAWRSDPARAPLLLVRPPVDPAGTFAFDRTVDFIEAGYRATHAALREPAGATAPARTQG